MNRTPRQFLSAWAGTIACRNLWASSTGGLLDVSIEARPNSATIGGRQTSYWGYNGLIPGPRLAAHPVEDWEIENLTFLDHPFHIHVNLFQLVANDGVVEPAMRDVINVARGSRCRIRMRFADFAGKTMYHCHFWIMKIWA